VDSANARVSVWSRTSTSDPWQPQTTIGNGSGNAYDQFIYPYGATVTPDGLALYVSDPGNNWISVWTRASSADPWQAQTPLGTYGTGNDQVAGPAGLTLAADGLALYIADQANRRIAIWIYA
jgi:DNA-binding beta-propeller fold protein YncE